jgi:hypothetical protein
MSIYNIKKEPTRSTLQLNLLVELNKLSHTCIELNEHEKTLYTFADLREGGGLLSIKNQNVDRKFITVCTAGLGNRIAALIGGLFYSEMFNTEFKFMWDTSTCCLASYTDLFENSPLQIKRKKFCEEVAINICNSSSVKRNTIKEITPQNLADNNFYVYSSAELPLNIEPHNIAQALNKFLIKKTIIDHANKFITQYKITDQVVGLHIRKIDPPEQRTNRFLIPINLYTSVVANNPSKKYFICSDSKEVENLFVQYKNVIIYSKQFYSDYKAEQDITYRGQQSVVEAFIDMLILSRTQIFEPSIQMSSFCQAANYYSNITLMDK